MSKNSVNVDNVGFISFLNSQERHQLCRTAITQILNTKKIWFQLKGNDAGPVQTFILEPQIGYTIIPIQAYWCNTKPPMYLSDFSEKTSDCSVHLNVWYTRDEPSIANDRKFNKFSLSPHQKSFHRTPPKHVSFPNQSSDRPASSRINPSILNSLSRESFSSDKVRKMLYY